MPGCFSGFESYSGYEVYLFIFNAELYVSVLDSETALKDLMKKTISML